MITFEVSPSVLIYGDKKSVDNYFFLQLVLDIENDILKIGNYKYIVSKISIKEKVKVKEKVKDKNIDIEEKTE